MELLHKRDEKIKKNILYIYIIHYICIYRCLRLSEAADTKAKEPQLLLADPDNTSRRGTMKLCQQSLWEGSSPCPEMCARELRLIGLKTAKKSAHSVVDNISNRHGATCLVISLFLWRQYSSALFCSESPNVFCLQDLLRHHYYIHPFSCSTWIHWSTNKSGKLSEHVEYVLNIENFAWQSLFLWLGRNSTDY
jgi:hypothetical protein